jgi:hypothetical protein
MIGLLRIESSTRIRFRWHLPRAVAAHYRSIARGRNLRARQYFLRISRLGTGHVGPGPGAERVRAPDLHVRVPCWYGPPAEARLRNCVVPAGRPPEWVALEGAATSALKQFWIQTQRFRFSPVTFSTFRAKGCPRVPGSGRNNIEKHMNCAHRSEGREHGRCKTVTSATETRGVSPCCPAARS